MKTKLMTLLLTAASAAAFAAPESANLSNELPLEVKQSLGEARVDRDWFGYMKMGVADSRPTDSSRVLPGLGLGWRYALPVGAIDISTSYTGTDAFAKEQDTYFYTVPRVSYLYYATPAKQQSVYLGAGLAYGGLKTTDATTFQGLVPSASIGYEMNRHENWRSFIQLDVSQPAANVSFSDGFSMNLAKASLGPVAELSVGFGY